MAIPKELDKTNKEIKSLKNKINTLKSKKNELESKNNLIFCPECKKYYKTDKCKTKEHFEKGGFFDYSEIKCPKGHIFYGDD